MTDKNPLDLLQEIHSMLKDLHIKIDITNKNLNILQNKTNTNIVQDYKTTVIKETPSIINDLNGKADVGIPIQQKNTRVTGKIYNADKKPVHSVVVKIMDANNNVVKTTKTNMAGIWASHLPPGKYSIKYASAHIPPSYRLLEIKSGQEEAEVI